MKNSVYSMFVIFAGVLWGIISIFLKGLYSAGFSALQVMFFRGFISSVFMAIFLFVKDKSLLKFKLKDIWLGADDRKKVLIFKRFRGKFL